MRRVLPLLILSFIFFFSILNNLQAQVDQSNILFIFDSKDALIKTLESPGKKTISFEIKGIESAQQVKSLKSAFEYSSERVTGFKIFKGKKGIYTGRLSLSADVRISHFTKILITCEIREIVVEGSKISTVALNDKSVYFTE